MDWRLLPKTGKLSFEFKLAMGRHDHRCVAPLAMGERCTAPATEVVGVSHGPLGALAYCELCRKRLYGLTPGEKSVQKARAQKKQGRLF